MNRINAVLLTLSLLLLSAAVIIANDGNGSGNAQESSTKSNSNTGQERHTGSSFRLLVALHSEPEYSGDISYDQSLYEHWIDADEDGENTQAEVLEAESQDGTWQSWFDGESIDDSSMVVVVHLVPLEEAHESGAWAWTPEKRRDYANDLDFEQALTAVSTASNESRGSKDPAEWQPSAETAWCRYAQDWIAVKNHWGLTYDAEELYALTAMLNTCEDAIQFPVPSAQSTPEHDHSHGATPTPEHSHSGTPTPGHSH
ncbi:MAG: hypothetical protein OXM03_09615 [Chloroflexota bacterium]|nr:hypothetical protein [Chloroflexota bacterium]MDE2840870.1 hypothetical protein [Chloroflexota bacterium]MDE2929811.1 hypothetical protein [Chloroflexota bacterium]